MIELVENADPGARIKVIGAGGCGGNAVNHMIAAGLRSVEFMSVNTDTQALQVNQAPLRMAIGQKLTRGRGTGGNPEIGRKAALEDEEVLREILANAEMVFVTAGMGGGTGTGSAPVIARIARDLGALTVGVVTKPFQFEGRKRMGQAEEGLRELKDAVDTLITIPNQRLLSIASRNTSLKEAFQRADDVLLQAVRGISELVTVHGLINLDFADVRSIMAEMGMAMMGAAHASGENRAVEAAQRAISSPLLEDVSIKGARGLLINVTGGPDMSLYEVNEAASLIQEEAHEDANIIFGAVIDDKISDEIHVTVIATGFGEQETRYAPRYAPSGTAITAPVQSAPTRPMDPMQPQPMMPPPVITPQPPLTTSSAAPVMYSPPPPAMAPAAAPQPSPVQPQAHMFGGKPVRRLGLIVDESSLDIPAFKRRASERSGGPTRLASDDTVDNDDKLDIPAFLRKPVE